jgi:hypothetical protein
LAERLRSTSPLVVGVLPLIVALAFLGLLVLVLSLTDHLGGAVSGCYDNGPKACSPAVFWNLGLPSLVVALGGYGYLFSHDISPFWSKKRDG